MKISRSLFLVFASVALAADVPPAPKFDGPRIGMPSLQLSAPSQAPLRTFPIGSKDLIGSKATRDQVIRDFWQLEGQTREARSKAKIPVIPLGPTDLIGRSIDREKLIDDFKRIEAGKKPNKAPEPTPTSVMPRANESNSK